MTTPRVRDLGRRAGALCASAVIATLAAAPAAAQTYEITWYTVDGGGATAVSGGTYVLGGTAGQPDAGGPLTGGTYSLSGGFWQGVGPDIDVSVTVTDAPDPVSALNTLTYTFQIANNGPDAASLVTLVNTLPPEATFVSAGGSGWTCGEAAGVVTCTLPALNVGPASDVVVQVTAPGSAGTLTATATISAAERDVDTANNAAQAETTVSPTPMADTSVVKSDGGAEAQWNEPLAYTIIVTNAGPDAAPATSVTDDFPASLLGVTWTCSASAGASCTPSGSGDIADTVSLDAGASITYTASAVVAYGTPSPITNTAIVVGGVADPDTSNNTSSTSTTVTDLIFRDGFESGDFSAWDLAQTGGGDLTVEAGAAMAGTTAGLQAAVNDTAGLFVQDDSPTDEDRYRARFYLDPTGFDPGETQNHRRTRVLLGFEEAPTRRLIAIVLRRLSGQYALMGRARQDDNSQADTGFFSITPGPHVVEVDWIRSTGPDANDGEFRLWIDGALRSTLTGLDNSISSVDFARLGALSVKVGATGVLRWDEFESRRQNYMGPLP